MREDNIIVYCAIANCINRPFYCFSFAKKSFMYIVILLYMCSICKKRFIIQLQFTFIALISREPIF